MLRIRSDCQWQDSVAPGGGIKFDLVAAWDCNGWRNSLYSAGTRDERTREQGSGERGDKGPGNRAGGAGTTGEEPITKIERHCRGKSLQGIRQISGTLRTIRKRAMRKEQEGRSSRLSELSYGHLRGSCGAAEEKSSSIYQLSDIHSDNAFSGQLRAALPHSPFPGRKEPTATGGRISSGSRISPG